MRKTAAIAALDKFDLAVIREELVSASEPLSEALKMPVEFISADRDHVAYAIPEGIMTASYSMNENEIEFDSIRVWDGHEVDDRKSDLREMVEAIEHDDTSLASRVFESISERAIKFIDAKSRVNEMIEPMRRKLEESIRQVPEMATSGFAPRSPYFSRSNFSSLSKLDEISNRVNEMLDLGVDASDTIVEAFRYKSRGGKVRKIKVNRKLRRLARKVARRNRASLIRNLKKARRQLHKVSSRPSFRRRVSKVRRLNASVDIQGIQNTLLEIATSQPRFAYLTTGEVERIVREALVAEGVKEPEKIVVEETAEALVRIARELLPESKKHIVQAASHYIRPDENVGSEDLDDAIECCLHRVYEASDAEDGDKLSIAKSIKNIVDQLVDQIEKDIDPDDSGEEADEMQKALEFLKGYQITLADFVDSPDDIDANRLGAIVASMEEIFYDGEEDDEEGKDKEDDEDKEGEDEGESEDEEGENEGEEDEDKEDKPKKRSRKSKKDDEDEEEPEDDALEDEEEADVEIGESFKASAKAHRALLSMLEALKKRESCPDTAANEWCHKGRKFAYTIDESVCDGRIFGRVYGPDGPEGTFLIEGNGEVKHWPTSTSRMVEASSCKKNKADKAPKADKAKMFRFLDRNGFRGVGDDVADSLCNHGAVYNEEHGVLVISRPDGYRVIENIDEEFISDEYSALDEAIRESFDAFDLHSMITAIAHVSEEFDSEPPIGDEEGVVKKCAACMCPKGRGRKGKKGPFA